jgi:hypothetical protein
MISKSPRKLRRTLATAIVSLLTLALCAFVPATTAFASSSPSAAPGSSAVAVTPTPASTALPTPTGAVPYVTRGPDGQIHTLETSEGPCVLYPSVVHQRKSGNYQVVGSKPYTTCDVPVTSIKQSTEMFKVAWWGAVPSGTFTGGNYGVGTYTQTNVATVCTNTLSTQWFSETTGTIIFEDTTYYSLVDSVLSTYPCGT